MKRFGWSFGNLFGHAIGVMTSCRSSCTIIIDRINPWRIYTSIISHYNCIHADEVGIRKMIFSCMWTSVLHAPSISNYTLSCSELHTGVCEITHADSRNYTPECMKLHTSMLGITHISVCNSVPLPCNYLMCKKPATKITQKSV